MDRGDDPEVIEKANCILEEAVDNCVEAIENL